MATTNFTTGPSTLPDVGALSYNGCTFSPLYATTVSAKVVQDEASRTTKFIEYVITADGYVTLPRSATSMSPTMLKLRQLLTAQAGALVYQGRGCDIIVNAQGGGAAVNIGVSAAFNTRDVAWGPVPQLLEFQPLGGGLSAKVRWQVTTRIPEVTAAYVSIGKKNKLGFINIPILQFNYDTTVTYTDDGFSVLSVSGTLEVPLTRANQISITVPYTADSLRPLIDKRIMAGINLSQFRVTNRVFKVSRDKRTLEFEITAEELPYMDMPPDCTVARGSYNVRPARVGAGLVLWMCTLRASYVVRSDKRRRTAWIAFLTLLRLRMRESENGDFRDNQKNKKLTKAWLLDFSFTEGLYLDSKTTEFSASWRMVTNFDQILLASGLWFKLPEYPNNDATKPSLWATSMQAVSGSQSWLPNQVNPKLDVIVDFGGGGQ